MAKRVIKGKGRQKKMKKTPTPPTQHGLANGYRSGLEVKNHEDLEKKGVAFEYESFSIPYTGRPKKYTPDFYLLDNGIIIETKGWFKPADRTKHLLVKEQHPDLDIRFVFSNKNAKLYKGAKRTYADWCDKHGFKHANVFIPDEWLTEPENLVSKRAVEELMSI